LPELTGLFVATLTPFDASNRLDSGAVRDLVSFLIESGVEGLCPCGTTGEFLYLSEAEKVQVVEATVRAANGSAPVMAGVWALSENETARLARAAEDAGADAVFLPPPIYYPCSQDRIVAWYRGVKTATRLPVFAYNIPAYAANSIETSTASSLVAEGTIAGIKDSTGSEPRMTELVARLGGACRVLAASDAFAYRARQIGAHGFISALANVAPDAMRAIWDGDAELQQRVAALRTTVKECGGIAAIKELSRLRGLDLGRCRQPCSELSSEQRQRLRSAWDAPIDS
jgi:4-hydroxy-tetrahydrodipicolinate synthase